MAEEVEKKTAASKSAADKPAAAKKAPAKAAAKPAAQAPAKAATAAKAEKPAAKQAPAKAAADKAPAKAASTAKAAKPAATKGPAKAAAPEAKAERVQLLKAHHLRPAPGAKKAPTRVGRGEGSKGKTAGRGTKGTKARNTVRVGLEGGNLNSIMRAPKLRGFKNPFRTEYQVVNVARLAELYPSGGAVTVDDLVAKGAVRGGQLVKVLGDGDLAVKLDVTVDKVSSSAQRKIVAAGGSVAGAQD
ncbi:MAG TPA: 50S ribosomal protein L15 [Microbacteriaceae bacterium]|nr:50S ribosomal protein L15 [Microbacteriaceae bacterium]